MLFALRNIVTFLALLGAGLLAGVLVGTGMAQFTAQDLPESSWVMRFQLEDHLFAKVMPPIMLSTLLALIVAFVVSRGHSRWLFGTSIALMLLVVAITVGFEVPLNKQIQSWTPGSAPPEWKHVRDLWLQNHLLRTIAATLAFASSLAARIV